MDSATKFNSRGRLLLESFQFRLAVLAPGALCIVWWLMPRAGQIWTINVLVVLVALAAPSLAAGAIWGWLTFDRQRWLRATGTLLVITVGLPMLLLGFVLVNAGSGSSSSAKILGGLVIIVKLFDLPEKPPANWIVKVN